MKVEIASSWLSLANWVESFLFSLFILFLPTQLGKHFWPNFAFLQGIRIDYLSPTVYITDILLVILFIISFLRKKIVVSPWFSLFLLFLGLNIYFSSSPLAGWFYFSKFLEVSFLAWYVARKNYSFTTIGLLFVLGILVESFIAFGQMFLQGSLGGLFYFLGERSFSAATPGIANASLNGQLFLRPYATFSHPNMFAGYVVVVLFLLFYLLDMNKKVIRGALFATLIIGTISVAISLSRTAVAAWFLGFFYFAFSVYQKIALRLLALSLVVSGVFSLIFPETALRFLPFSFGQSLVERAELATVAMQMIFSHPFLGVGLGNFLPTLLLFSANNVPLQPVHNIYLLVASETGIVGFGIFVWFLWKILFKIFLKIQKGMNSERVRLLSLFLSLQSILFMGLFDHYWITLQQGQLLFALVVGLIFREISRDTISS